MAETLRTSKAELVARALAQMNGELTEPQWSIRQKLALTCRILFDGGHDSGLAGQITARAPEAATFYTQPFGHGFDEITASNLLRVNQDLATLDGKGMPNPANRFHTWIYRARQDVNCIIHYLELSFMRRNGCAAASGFGQSRVALGIIFVAT
ncbi:class II aldolase/adducin family protein, partial [Paraburkholderia bengalensis]